MGLQLSDTLVARINDPRTVKAVASAGKDGTVHLVFKGSVSVNAEGNIQFLELFETSQTNKNLVYSLWFKRPVSITILGQDGSSWQIKGVPVRAIVCGREFEKNYAAVRGRLGKDADLSTVWIIKPEEAHDQSYTARKQEEEDKYPLIAHLDRFAK